MRSKAKAAALAKANAASKAATKAKAAANNLMSIPEESDSLQVLYQVAKTYDAHFQDIGMDDEPDSQTDAQSNPQTDAQLNPQTDTQLNPQTDTPAEGFIKITDEFLNAQYILYAQITDLARFVCAESTTCCSCGALPGTGWVLENIDYIPYLNKNTLFHIIMDHYQSLATGTTFDYLKSYDYLVSITDYMGNSQECDFCNKILLINCGLRDLSMLVKIYITLAWEHIRDTIDGDDARSEPFNPHYIPHAISNALNDSFSDQVSIAVNGIHANATIDFIARQFPPFTINYRGAFNNFIAIHKRAWFRGVNNS